MQFSRKPSLLKIWAFHLIGEIQRYCRYKCGNRKSKTLITNEVIIMALDIKNTMQSIYPYNSP
jgi:hypothetical protein